MFDNRKIRVVLVCLVALCLMGMGVGVGSASAKAPTPHFTFTYGSSVSPAERAQYESWLNPSGTVMKTVQQVYGPPATNLTIEVTKETNGFAGEYSPYGKRIAEAEAQLAVTVHELSHATRDTRDLSESVLEEGLARAGEKEVMRLLKLQGITEAGYDTTHEYGYDEYYDNDNVLAVGVPNGNIFVEAALTLLRYEQSGYAIGKIMMEDPQFEAQFDTKLAARSNAAVGPGEFVTMAAEIQPTVEGQPTTAWMNAQHIFDNFDTPGCYVFVRANQFTVDSFCIDQYSNVTMQNEAKVTLKIQGPHNEVVFKESGTTSEYGWVGFEPALESTMGRLKITATAKSSQGQAKTIVYRQAGAAEGVFGVVTNAPSGTVRFSSPTESFPSVTVQVESGAFVAPTLGSVRGLVKAEYVGPSKSVTREFAKDAAPYSLVLTAAKVKKSKP